MAKDNESLDFEILEDYGSFGDSKWMKHLTKIKWGDNEPKYDIRSWNEDMSKMGKGVTLTMEDLLELYDILDEIINGDSKEDNGEDLDWDVDDYEVGDYNEHYDE